MLCGTQLTRWWHTINKIIVSRYDTQLTRCCVEIIHNYQDLLSDWYTIKKMLCGDNRLITKHLLWIWHPINKMLCRDNTQLPRFCVQMIHN